MFDSMIQPMDTAVFQWFNGLAGQNHILDGIMIALTKFGDPLLIVGLLFFCFYGTSGDRKAFIRGFLLAVVTIVVAWLITVGIHQLWFRPRPFTVMAVHQLVSHVADSSMPSHHALASVALALGAHSASKRVGIAYWILGILIIISSVYVGVHYPTDLIVGGLLAYIVWRFVWMWRQHIPFYTRFCNNKNSFLTLA